MKRIAKCVSLLLAMLLALNVTPLSAGARASLPDADSLEALCSQEGVSALAEYLITQVYDHTELLPTMLRVFLLAGGEDLKARVGGADLTYLTGEQEAKIFVEWLDGSVLPEVQKGVEANEKISALVEFMNMFPDVSFTVDLSTVQNIFDTAAQTSEYSAYTVFLGDMNSLNVDAAQNVTVTDGYLTALQKLIRLAYDNLGVIKRLIAAKLDLGALQPVFREDIEAFNELPDLIKSYMYKLIDPAAAPGKLKKGETGGDWAKSAYGGFSADRLLAAAVIRRITKTESPISAAAADEALGTSVYGLMAKYAPAIYADFAVDLLNKHLPTLFERIPEAFRAQFAAEAPVFTADTFNDVFAGAETGGLLGQLNNVLVKTASLLLSESAFQALAPEYGDNTKLNDNLTKLARYALPVMIAAEDALGYAFSEEIKNTDPETLSLPALATVLMKPVFTALFGNTAAFSEEALNAADTLPKTAVLGVYWAAANPDWLQLDYEFTPITAQTLAGLDENGATELLFELGKEIALGAIGRFGDLLPFTVTVDGADWRTALTQLENFLLDVIDGFPAAARAHDLKNKDEYGPFYKLNVLLNECFDFSFLNGAGGPTFRLDLEALLRNGVLARLYKGDVAGILKIFEKNDAPENPLNAPVVSAVLKGAKRLLTALFEHDCGEPAITAVTEDDPAAPCTKQIRTEYEYCALCGAYFSRVERGLTKQTPEHVYGARVTTKSAPDDSLIGRAACNYKLIVTETCTVCGYVHTISADTARHSFPEEPAVTPATCTTPAEAVYECAVCGYRRVTQNGDPLGHTPGAAVRENETPATCISGGAYDEAIYCTVCGEALSREHKTTSIAPDAHAYGDWQPDNDERHVRVCANDAAHVLYEAHKWDDGAFSETDGTVFVLTCTVCGYRHQNTPPLPALKEAWDIPTNIGVYYPENAFGGEITLRVEKIEAAERLVSLLPQTYASTAAYTVTALLNGKAVHPGIPVDVSIPLPGGFAAATTAVYRIGTDGAAVRMTTEIIDGKIVFNTADLSTFAVIDTAREIRFERGKVNEDDVVGTADARLALRAAIGLEDYAPFTREFSAADVNNDGTITTGDARTILRAAIGLETL